MAVAKPFGSDVMRSNSHSRRSSRTASMVAPGGKVPQSNSAMSTRWYGTYVKSGVSENLENVGAIDSDGRATKIVSQRCCW